MVMSFVYLLGGNWFFNKASQNFKKVEEMRRAPITPKPVPLQTVPRVFVDMDGVIVDFEAQMIKLNVTAMELKRMRGAYLDMPVIPGAIGGIRSLIGMGFEVWIATKPPTGVPWAYGDKAQWVMNNLPELKRRIIITHDKGLLGDENDYLIDDRPFKANCHKFKGKFLHFTDEFHWKQVLERLAPGSINGVKSQMYIVK